ncbi:hydrophobic surface binding protein A-domain-containing protein [Alternaria alternata]|nr:hydrophobic surface binding protein A-domain-containing protein [Alternaria alternata]
MHFSLSLLFLSTIAFCSPVPQVLPTAQDVTQSVINIHNAVLELDATVQAFQGGSFETAIVEGKEVLAGVAKIHAVNREGFRRATLALPPFSVEDTIKFIDTVVATVDVSIPNATKHLREKEPVFKANGFSAIVIASLALLEFDHDTFSAAAAKNFNLATDKAKLAEGVGAAANIHSVIQDTIVFYTVSTVV